MRWVDQYLTTHHLFHAPHKWFWAVLLSPLHAAETHYKNRYHLTFVHAKKLFFFDMLLLLSIGLLIAGSTVWFTYDPTVLDNISLKISASTDRIKAGQRVAYTIEYTNNSEKTLFDPILIFQLPAGFVIDAVEPKDHFNTESRSLTLPTLHANSNGIITVRGWFHGTPEGDERVVATLSYRAEDRSVREQKNVSIIATLRGSLVTAILDLPDTIVSPGSTPFTLTITNSEESPVREISIPLSFGNGITLDGTPSTSAGKIEKNIWSITRKDTDAPFTKATLIGMLNIHVPEAISKKDISVTPTVSIGTTAFPQIPAIKNIQFVHPTLATTITWKDGVQIAEPGKNISATITMANTGNVSLSNIDIRMPLQGIIDIPAIKKGNKGIIEKDTFILSHTQHANLLSLPPQSSTSLEVTFPIKKTITSGEHVQFILSPTINAYIPSIADGRYQIHTKAEPVKISSSLTLQAELRYFTADGDQVGRGPLPPQTGRETKYWAFIHLFNRTNKIDDVTISAILPPGVTWTGKSSVSHGREAEFNSVTRTITWSSPSMTPHSQAGVYLELAITPDSSQTGKTPTLLTKLSAQATDSFTGQSLLTSHTALDISVPADKQARESGITVQ